MRFLFIAFLALLAAGTAMAFSVNPDYLGIRDSGNPNLPRLNVSISIDCDSKVLTVGVASNATGEPVGGANAYLFYTDYAYQLIASGTTGTDGIANINVMGSRNYLTDLFIMHVEKPAFQTREIEFTYKKCFEAPPKPPKNNTQQNQTGQNGTAQQNASGTQGPQSNGTAQNATNRTGNAGPGTANASQGPGNTSITPPGPETRNPQPAAPCLPALLLAPLALLAAIRR